MMKRKMNKAQREERKHAFKSMSLFGRFRQRGTMGQWMKWFGGMTMKTCELVNRIADEARKGHEASDYMPSTVGNRGSFRPAGSKYARRMSRREDGKSNRRLCCA